MNREELAWAAGFYEGEGTIVNNQTNGRNRLLLSVTQRDREMLDRFAGIFGFGQVYGPYDFNSRPGRDPIHRYAAYGFEKTQAVIAMIWPWLSGRRKEQAREVLRRYHEARKK